MTTDNTKFMAWYHSDQPELDDNAPDGDDLDEQHMYWMRECWKAACKSTWDTAWKVSRERALEDAAKICDDLQNWPSSECRHCATDIRGLK